MKKLFFILPLLFAFIACENESTDTNNNNNNNNNDPNTDLVSYFRTFPSGNTAEYIFENGKLTEHYSNEILSGKVEYDNTGNLTKYTDYSNNGEIENSYLFNYDTEGAISFIEEFHSNGPFEDSNFTRMVEYNGNTISIPLPDTDDESLLHSTEYTFNTENLLVNSKQIHYDGSVTINNDFSYDANKNCIGVVATLESMTQTADYTYDSFNNPLQDYYQTYYLNWIIIYGRMDGLSYLLPQTMTTFGGNNKTATNYVGNESANTVLEYTYENNFPTQAVAKYEFNGSIASTTGFYYE